MCSKRHDGKMPAETNPDAFNMDIPILTRDRPVQKPSDRDLNDIDIPILSRDAFHLQALYMTTKAKESRQPCPPTPAYWSEAMEQETECQRRQAALEDGWVITTERGKFVGRVDLDDMTA